MKKTVTYLVVGLILIIVVSSCARVRPARWTYLDRSKFTTLESIPSAYGQLKAVNVMQENPEWSELWFQDDAGTVRIVLVNWFDKKMVGEPVIIKRS